LVGHAYIESDHIYNHSIPYTTITTHTAAKTRNNPPKPPKAGQNHHILGDIAVYLNIPGDLGFLGGGLPFFIVNKDFLLIAPGLQEWTEVHAIPPHVHDLNIYGGLL